MAWSVKCFQWQHQKKKSTVKILTASWYPLPLASVWDCAFRLNDNSKSNIHFPTSCYWSALHQLLRETSVSKAAKYSDMFISWLLILCSSCAPKACFSTIKNLYNIHIFNSVFQYINQNVGYLLTDVGVQQSGKTFYLVPETPQKNAEVDYWANSHRA